MKIQLSNAFILIVFINIILSCSENKASNLLHYQNAYEAGFSGEKLNEVRELFNESEGAALLVLHDGHVLLSHGETTRKFRLASMRKSIMNAMIGIAIENDKIDLNASLQELGIDDKPPLTDIEKKATVEDLLSARSGIYHMAAYMPRSMKNKFPERGSSKPGQRWFYNNWDFNTLVTIYNQQTGSDFFEDFDSQIAQKTGMQDFSLDDTFYRYDKENSIHPAYLFRMSARDLAQFGQLYLNNGEWHGNQIVPADWIEKSTTAHSFDLGDLNHKGDYGYLWWVADSLIGQKMYFASGSGGQRILVIPGEDLIIVHLVNTYDNNDVNDGPIFNLVEKILSAKTGQPVANPELKEYIAPKIEKPQYSSFKPEEFKKYTGTYKHRFLGDLEILMENKQMYLLTGIGKFKIYPTGEKSFYPEDIQTPLEFQKAGKAQKPNTVESVYNERRKVERVIFYY